MGLFIVDIHGDIEGDYEIIRKYEEQTPIHIGSIPYLMHKELDAPISECQKAYDIAMEYLRSQAKVKG